MRLEIYIEPVLDSNDEKWKDDEDILNTLQKILPKYDVVVDAQIYGDVLLITIRGSENDIRALADELRQRVPVVQVMGDEDCVCYGYAIATDPFTSIGQIEYFCICDSP